MPDLTGKTALVTGASRGIGRAIAHTLARHGAFVLVHGRQPGGEADEVARAIQAEGGAAACVHAELLDDDGPEQLVRQVETVLSARGGDLLVDVLVNNAGVIRREPIEAVTRAEFDRTLGVNLRAPFFLIQQMLPRLRDGGRIVNISSMGTRVAYPAMAAYAPAKAGIEALTRLLAVHLGSRGITVHAPGQARHAGGRPGHRDDRARTPGQAGRHRRRRRLRGQRRGPLDHGPVHRGQRRPAPVGGNASGPGPASEPASPGGRAGSTCSGSAVEYLMRSIAKLELTSNSSQLRISRL